MLQPFVLPLLGRHACEGLEGTEEGGLIGKACLYIDVRHFPVRVLADDALGVLRSEGVDILIE